MCNRKFYKVGQGFYFWANGPLEREVIEIFTDGTLKICLLTLCIQFVKVW